MVMDVDDNPRNKIYIYVETDLVF